MTGLRSADMTTHTYLKTSGEIEKKAVHLTREFLQHAVSLNSPPVEWTFIKVPDSRRLRKSTDHDQSIRVVERNGTLYISICSKDLLLIPLGALQGWLELKIVHAMIEADTNSYRFNFQNQIRPLMRLAGGSLYFIRELVEHLSRALKRRETTKIISQMDRGLPQVYYYFYTINPTAEDRELYKKLMPHNWSRASHLCGKLGNYIALSYLADQGVGFSRSLLSDWPKQYGYTQKDQSFMEDMVSISDYYQDREFSFQLVEMFKLLRETLLVAGSSDTPANNPGLTV
jgi:hypothetical protein